MKGKSKSAKCKRVKKKVLMGKNNTETNTGT